VEPVYFLIPNLLLVLIVGRSDEGLIARFKRTKTFSADDFHLLLRLTALYANVVTSPHVLTEVNSFLNQLAEPLRARALAELRTLSARLTSDS